MPDKTVVVIPAASAPDGYYWLHFDNGKTVGQKDSCDGSSYSWSIMACDEIFTDEEIDRKYPIISRIEE